MTQGFSSSPNPLRTVPSHRAADPPHSGPTEFYLLPWITAPWAPLPPGGQGHYVRVTDLVHLNSSVIYCGFVYFKPKALLPTRGSQRLGKLRGQLLALSPGGQPFGEQSLCNTSFFPKRGH